jgi:hypothetical protein
LIIVEGELTSRANQQRIDALEWAAANRAEFIGKRTAAVQHEIAKWQSERAGRK